MFNVPYTLYPQFYIKGLLLKVEDGHKRQMRFLIGSKKLSLRISARQAGRHIENERYICSEQKKGSKRGARKPSSMHKATKQPPERERAQRQSASPEREIRCALV